LLIGGAVIASTFAGCASNSAVAEGGVSAPSDIGSASSSSPREALAELMEGEFRSATQAEATADLPDEERFLDIVVRVERIDAWDGRGGAVWLYMEQAVARMPDRPYRQRVYKLKDAGDGVVTSTVLWLPGEDAQYVGAWRDASLLASVSPGELEARGCVVRLRDVRNEAGPWLFAGETVGDGCPSDFRGAVRATSAVRFAADRFEAWDRGWNASGEQVWGPTTGPYVFDRVTPSGESVRHPWTNRR
jgi:hypothetical protein